MSAQEKYRGQGPHLISTCFPWKKKNKQKKTTQWYFWKVTCSIKTSEGHPYIITNLSFFMAWWALCSRVSARWESSTCQHKRQQRQIQIWSLVALVLTASQLSGLKSVADNRVQHKPICVHLLWPSSAGQSMEHQELYKHLAPLTTKHRQICVLRCVVYVVAGLSHKNVILFV